MTGKKVKLEIVAGVIQVTLPFVQGRGGATEGSVTVMFSEQGKTRVH
jgi:hypothetical protein